MGGWIELAPAVLLNLLIVLLPYAALMALVSAMAKSARQATIYAIILWVITWFLARYLQAYFPQLSFLDWVMPGSQIPGLIRVVGWDAINFALIPLLQTVVLLAAGLFTLQTRDL